MAQCEYLGISTQVVRAWRLANDFETASSRAFPRALLLTALPLLLTAGSLTAVSSWRWASWTAALGGSLTNRIKASIALGIPALYFAMIGTNALAREAPERIRFLRLLGGTALALAAASSLLFWLLPVVLTHD